MTNKWVAETQLVVLEICLAYRKKRLFPILIENGGLLGGESTYWNWVLRVFHYQIDNERPIYNLLVGIVVSCCTFNCRSTFLN